MSEVLRRLREQVHGYWTGAPVPADENPKQAAVRQFCEFARECGLTEQEVDDWARYQLGEPTVAVVSLDALEQATRRLRRPGGARRFRARIARERQRAERMKGGKT